MKQPLYVCTAVLVTNSTASAYYVLRRPDVSAKPPDHCIGIYEFSRFA